jgi:DNA primase
VVATAGTALTEWHLKALARLTPHVTLSFDADKAGLNATERAIPIAAATNVELTITTLPEGAKDPDELIQKDPSLWRRAIDEAHPVVDWVLGQYSAREDMAAAAGKRRFTTAANSVVRALPHSVEREHYLKQIADMTDTSLEAVSAKLNDTTQTEMKRLKAVKGDPDNATPTFNTHQDNLLAVFMIAPATRHLLEGFDTALFQSDERRQLADFFKTNPNVALGVLPSDLTDIETYGKIVELKAETRYGDWTESDLELEAARLLRYMEMEHKKQRKDQLLERLRDAETAGDDALSLELRQELHQIIRETAHG